MGILFADGFDSYASSPDLTKKWLTTQSPWSWVSNGGRSGGGCIQAATTGGNIIKPLSAGFSANSLVCYVFMFKGSASPASVSTFLQPRNAAGAVLGPLRITTAGKFALYSSVLSLLATGSVNVCDGNWHWCELYLSEGSGLTNKLIVDGLTEWNTSAFNTGTAGPQDSFELTSVTGITITVDDFIAFDDSTGNPQSAALPLGPRQIITVRPQADSTVAFTTATGGGTHFDQVDEVNADSDVTYVESANSGDQDLYDFAAMGISPATITAVVANAFVENPNAGVINFAQVAKSSTTTTVGATTQAPTAYQTRQQPFPVDPATSAAWASASAVDNATFGVKVV